MDMNTTLELAIQLACRAHEGQLDKAGLPVIMHPLSVMSSMDRHDLKGRIVAVLHDVMEDCDSRFAMELNDLIDDEEIFAALLAITIRAEEPYFVFIRQRVARNPLAVKVKLADIEDNLDRAYSLPAKDKGLVDRWTKAKAILETT